jgi:hypothetical protein
MVTICSIDIGVKHLAIIIFDPVTNRILYWTIHTLNLVNGSFSQSISSLMSKALFFMTETVAIIFFFFQRQWLGLELGLELGLRLGLELRLRLDKMLIKMS